MPYQTATPGINVVGRNLATLEGAEVFSGIKTFTANPVFNNDSIPLAKIIGNANLLKDNVAATITQPFTFSSNPIFSDNAIPWAKVNKSGSLLSELGGGISYAQLPSGAGTWSATPTISALVITGDITLGNDIFPDVGNTGKLGTRTTRFAEVNAVDLIVSTLVKDTIVATDGGHFVIPKNVDVLAVNVLIADTTITTEKNILAIGDKIILQADGNTEGMKITSGPTGTGPYTYGVTRNWDGSGANAWLAGDAIINTGQTGDGLIDIFSNIGFISGRGPSIIGRVRSGDLYTDLPVRWVIGNLNETYGYVANVFGVAMGDPATANIVIDPTNGIRIRHGVTNKILLDAAGNASFDGTIVAISGNIGGWTLGATTLTGNAITLDATNGKIVVGTLGASVTLSGLDVNYRLWAGNTSPTSAPFSVKTDGTVKMSSAIITGADLKLGDGTNTAFDATSALKFARATGRQYGEAGDIFALYNECNSAVNNLILENTVKGGGDFPADCNVYIKAQGWSDAGAGSSTTLAQLRLRSQIGTSDLQVTSDTINLNGTISSSVQPRCRAYNSGTQNIPNDTLTIINLGNEYFDVGSMHDNAVNNSRITAPTTGAGVYLITGRVYMGFSASGAQLSLNILINGVLIAAVRRVGSTLVSTLEATTIVTLVGGDYVQMSVYQNTGSAQDVGSGTGGLENSLEVVKLW